MAFVALFGIVFLVSATFAWWGKSAINERLVTEHRDFLRNVKVRERPTEPYHKGDDPVYTSQFSIEIDGVKVNYNQLYLNPALIAKLDDPELLRLSRVFRNWLFVSGMSLFVFVFCFFWVLAE